MKIREKLVAIFSLLSVLLFFCIDDQITQNAANIERSNKDTSQNIVLQSASNKSNTELLAEATIKKAIQIRLKNKITGTHETHHSLKFIQVAEDIK